MFKYRRQIVSVVAILLALLMVFGIVSATLAAAVSSSEIKEKLEGLQDQADEIAQKQKELAAQIASNEAEQLDLVQKKAQIDQSIALTQEEIDNKNEQIQEYNLLIAEKQNELDDALAQESELNGRYRERVRAMEENGKVSYWSILFKASSFTDLLDRVDMINEIAAADNKMLQQLHDVAIQIETAREELAAEKVELEAAKEELAATEASLEEQRAQSDGVLNQLLDDQSELNAAADKYEAMEAELTDQIAKQEAAYQTALSEEEAARRAAEEAAKQQQPNNNNNNPGGSPGSSGGSGTSSSGFIWPAYGAITCAYGYRIHPITGKYSFHSGIDIGAAAGSPIYASKSGTVTTATYTYVYGYYVTINHGDGYSTLYGHMTNYIVSPGQYVTQGQVIGYVGSTGWSTGPHLHFTMYYNGSTVNPANYLK